MKRLYESHKFGPGSRTIIAHANDIVADYANQGYGLTLRQLYYQFVARDLIPNNQREYKRLGGIINDARLAGKLDWDGIEDRTRNIKSLGHWSDPADMIEAARRSYRTDIWEGQTFRPEVWVEKDALVGVIERTANTNDVPYFSCRGYTSQSEIWGAAQRLRKHMVNGQRPVILHLGDHDPSGIDMTRDITERLNKFILVDWMNDNLPDELFAAAKEDGAEAVYDAVTEHMREVCGVDTIEVRRLALNMDQVVQYDPPPNPTKFTDSRARGYVAEFGQESWELDALDPSTLDGLIQAELDDIIDGEEMDLAIQEQEHERQLLAMASDRWDDIVRMLEVGG